MTTPPPLNAPPVAPAVPFRFGGLLIITAVICAAGFALALSLIWFWMIATSPRSPMRGTMHWMAGLTLFWVLVATLLMPWIDYGKTYRSIATGMAKALPPKIDCIVNANLPNAVLGTLDYFSGIRTVPLTSTSAGKCHWLVMYGEPRDAKKMADAGWRKVWEGKRPGDRRERAGSPPRSPRSAATGASVATAPAPPYSPARHSR